ncbi:MAG: PDZ domain-containing protein [Holophagaceae bacterium]|nr:PDZ domain-containing protein [Holophagaceae bacterium]
MKLKHLTVACFLTAGTFAQSQAPLLLRTPALNRSHIVFSHASDLWIVGREGGDAKRLTSGIGVESRPYFSPNGDMVAFTGEYEGNVDVYVVPTAGGVPKRLTFHPGADLVEGWTPDGKVIFSSARYSQANGRTSQLFTISPDEAWPELLPLPMASHGSFSPDGKYLAYEPLGRAFSAWKRYRGGRASYIWIAEMKDSSVVKIPRTDSNDFSPMWIDTNIYFLSDRQGPITLFSYNVDSKQVERVINNTGLDMKSASAGPGAIVYEQFGTIHLFDLASRQSRVVNINVQGDMPGVRPRFEPLANRIASANISPTGARAIFEARGEIFTVPAEKGSARNITGTPGVMERSPAWSPDGKYIAYFSDASGEYDLHIATQDGVGSPKIIKLEPSFYYQPTWSPDSKKIVFMDKRSNVWLVDIEKGSPEKLDTFERGGQSKLAWSPDSQWIAYIKSLANSYDAVFVCSLQTRRVNQITDGMSDASNPDFDRSGKYLYFAASTNIGPMVQGFDMNSYPHSHTRSVYLTVLKKGEPSPLAPESDDEKDGSQTPADGKSADNKPSSETIIDFDGIDQRILSLPISNRNIIGLQPGKAGFLFVAEGGAGRQGAGGNFITLHKFDLKKKKLEKIAENIQNFTLSANAEKALWRLGGSWLIASPDKAPAPTDPRLSLSEVDVRIDPKAEWAQMYKEAWRIQRDYFYDPGHHGLDIKATEANYAKYVDGLNSRADLNYLFDEMFGNLTVGHLYVRGGDIPSVRSIPGGLLGADYKVENGRYRVVKVYNGENWNPDLRAPLTEPGSEVSVGEYILAINGIELTEKGNLHKLLENKSGRQVVLRVGPDSTGKNAREVTVVPVGNENGLRNLDWIESNRRHVAQATGGRLAYVWLPDTAQGGYTNFNRYWFAQLDRDGAVIDERFNGGGSAADYIIDYLRRPINSYWAVRDGKDWRQPFGTMPGPKAMLINEHAGSGGDYMPWLFKRYGLGPLVGKRTWGGLVGIGGYPVLMDGGSVTAPHFAFYTPEGRFAIENEGVTPDVEVDLDPKAWREGRDTQLERAIALVMDELRKSPPVPMKRPDYPRYVR